MFLRCYLSAWVLACAVIGASEIRGVTAAEETSLARIDGQPVTAAEVKRELRLANDNKPVDDRADAQLRRAALDQVIDRRLVLAYLTQAGEAASAKDVDLTLAQFQKELQAQNLTLEQHCQQVGLTKDELRRSLAWKASWKRYCEKQLTPVNLEKYFARYRREFDGTQLRVAQILLKTPDAADEAAITDLKQRAVQLREQVVAGKLSFEAAAREHSQSPSGKAGGDLGWIERRRPMPENFSQAAFALKKGEVSQPLVTPFGVHLITVLEEKPGSLTWQDAEAELRPAVTLYLFRWIADNQRKSAKVEYLQATP